MTVDERIEALIETAKLHSAQIAELRANSERDAEKFAELRANSERDAEKFTELRANSERDLHKFTELRETAQLHSIEIESLHASCQELHASMAETRERVNLMTEGIIRLTTSP